MVKVSVLIKRKNGMSSADFHRYWKEKHGPLALGVTDFICHISRYVQCHQISKEALQAMGRAESQYDGIVELWADSIEEMKRAFDSPGYKNIIQPDESNFCDDTDVIFMMTEEVVMKPSYINTTDSEMKFDLSSRGEQAKAIARKLKLEPIPVEGGYYAATFRSADEIESPKRLGGGLRKVASAIYFMLYKDFNTMHRMRTNEIWCYHGGATLTLYEIKDDGTLITHKLGNVLEAEENQAQVVIEANSWMAAELANDDDYVLVTCCVAPGWEPTDYEFANLKDMCAKHPEHKDLFTRLIRVKANSSETDMDYQSPPI